MIRLKLYDANGTTLQGLLPEPISFQIGLEFNEIGGLSFDYPASGVNASLISILDEIAVTDELGNEIANARFVITGINGDRTKPNGTLTINARSILWRLDTALAYPDGGILSGEVVRTFTGATAGTILKTLIDDAQVRTALSGLTYTFTNTLDSLGISWPDTTDTEYQARSTILSVIRSLSDLGLVEVETNARVLKASSADGLGLDKTLGATPIVLRTGFNVTEAPEESSADRLGSVALVEGDEGVIFERSNTPAVTAYGRMESSFTTSGIVDEIVMAAMSDAYLSTIALPARQLTLGLALVDGAPVPFKDFSVGDYVYTSTSQGLERVRVRQITLSMASNKFSASVTLGDRIYENEIRVARKLAAITSGSVNLGNGAPTTTPSAIIDTISPSAPTGLTGTSTAYLDNNQPRSAVSLSWTAPTTNANLTPLTDLIGYGLEKRTDPAAAWEYAGGSDSASSKLSGLEAGKTHYFRVSAVDASGNKSAPSTSFTIASSTITTAPAGVSAPTLSVKLGTITLIWNGLDALGAAMASDFRYVDIHRSITSGFTPSTSTKVGQFSGKDLAVYSDLTYGTAYYFKLIAYNTSGLASSPSTEATATVTALVNTDLIAGTLIAANFAGGSVSTAALATGAVDASKILAGAVTTAKIAASAIGANEIAANAIIAGKIAANAVTAGTIEALAINAGHINANAITADKIEAGAITAVKISSTAIDGKVITGATVRTAASGARIEMNSSGFGSYNSGGSATFFINSSTGVVTIGGYATTAATQAAADAAAAAQTTANGAASTASTANSTANSASSTASTANSNANTAISNASTANTNANTAISNASTAQTTANGKITAGGAATDINNNATTISGGKITANSITASQISSSYIYAGTINAGNITAGTLSASVSLAAVSGTIGGFTLTGSTITNGSSMTLYNNGDFYTGGVVSAGGGLYSTAGCSFGSTLNVTGSSTFGVTSHSGQMNYAGIATGSGTSMVLVSTGSRVAIVTSSERFKQEIQYINTIGWLDKVLQMRPVTYKTNVDFTTPGEPNETQIGFLAEDIYDIGGDLEKAVILDPLGDPFSLSYDRLTVFLMLAIKELKNEIEILKGN